MSWFDAISSAISGGGFSMSESQVIEATRALEDALKKSTSGLGTIGYQTPPGMDATSDISPLLTQSIDDALATATTYDDNDFVIFDRIPKDKATQTMHEIRRHTSHGDKFLDLAAAEGEAGVNDFSSFEPDHLQIKYWVTRREMSYVAANMGQILVQGSLLAQQTKEAMTQLLRRLEIDTIWGDSDLNSLQTDGLVKQIEAKGLVDDLAGQQLTFDAIERKLSEISNVDVGARPSHMFVTPDVWHDLSRQAQDGKGRFQSDGEISGRNFTYGSTGLSVFSPDSNRKIKVEKVPFLDNQRAYGSAYKKNSSNQLVLHTGYDPKSKAPSTLGISSQPAAAANAASKFLTDDAGAYKYFIMGVNEFGYSVTKNGGNATLTAAVTVAKGDRVTILLNVPDTLPRYYHVFRTDKNGADTTARYLFSTKHNTDGAGGKVSITDDNAVRAKASRVLLVNFSSPEQLAFYRMLPLARIPLAQVELKIPFVLFMSGGVKAKVPEKQHIWKNVGVANPL